MKKILLVISIIFLCGCMKETYNKVDLSSNYYNEGKYIEVKHNELKENETYLLFIYNSYCNFEIPCDEVFLKTMKDYKLDILKMPFEEFKKTSMYQTVKYAPSVILVENNKVIAYLDANKEEDLKYYQDSSEFTNWLKKYINIKKN